MVRDVAFGQYFPANSVIHKCDPRAKLIMLVGFLVIIFCTFNYASLALVVLFTALFVAASKVPAKFYFKSMMKPLAKLHFPVHEIAMMMSLALRFVPTLLEETDKITQAQKARGADMESGNIIQRVKAFIPILIPLFVSAFRRAYELATAMECRCYRGGTGRTRMKTIHMAKRDYVSFVMVALLIGGVILCNIFLPAAV